MGIRGYLRKTEPNLPAYFEIILYLPRLNISGFIRFQVDTGATCSMLGLGDAEELQVGFSRLDEGSIRLLEGIGGRHSFFVEDAELFFGGEDAAYRFETRLYIPGPGSPRAMKRQRQLCSLLGRDILSRCNLIIRYRENYVEMEAPDEARLAPSGGWFF